MKGPKKNVGRGKDKKKKKNVPVDAKQRKEHVQMSLDEFSLGESGKLRKEKEEAEAKEREAEEQRLRELKRKRALKEGCCRCSSWVFFVGMNRKELR